MPDYGEPGSYLTLADGTHVFGSDGGEIGKVAHVLAAPEEDIFDGLVIKTGDGHRFADASEVDGIFERGVVLTIPAADAGRLPEPSANPAAMSADPDDAAHGRLEEKLRRAWDLLSGKY